jgi:hypothetical protein
VPMCLTLGVANQTSGIGNTDLLTNGFDHAGRHFCRIVEERPEESHGAELDSETETHVVPSTPAYKVSIRVVEVEETLELIWRRLAVEATVALLLLLAQKADGYDGRLAKLLSFAGPRAGAENLGIWTCEI